MTLAFFLIASALAALALLLVIAPILRNSQPSGVDRRRKNIEIARQRLDELAQRQQSGEIDDSDANLLREEIERELLQDVDAAAAGAAAPIPEPVADRRVRGWTLAAAVVLIPSLAGILYLQFGSPQLIHLSPPFAAAPDAARQSADEQAIQIERQIVLYSERLEADPDNPQLWEELGFLYLESGRILNAAAAFREIRRVGPDQVSSLLLEAQALSFTADAQLRTQAHALVMQALQIAPQHPNALLMAGVLTAQQGDYHGALTYWEQALPLLAPQDRERIEQLLASTRAAMEQALLAQAGDGAGAVRVRVSLDDALAAQIDASDTVFVFAQAVSGPQVPLAAVKHQAGELPLEVVLSDALAMVPNMKLSAFEDVMVVARVSKTGAAQASGGDLVGQSEVFRPADYSLVEVVISQVVE